MERTVEKGCDQLVTVCADLKRGEKALIVSDPSTQALGDKLSSAAARVTSHVVHKIAPLADMHGKEPPAEIASAMKKADVIFGITKMSMAHTQARHAATSGGSRYLSLPDYTADLLKRKALYVDFRKITPIADHLAAILTAGKKVNITTPLGTNLTLNISGRKGNSAPGWCYAKGSLSSPPDAEANVPPLETESEGILIVDGSIPCSELGLLSEPIVLQLNGGKAKAVEGRQAALLEEVFNRRNNDAVRVAAEFGIGLNPQAELIGSMLEDEGCLGTIHIGFGSNSTIGGCNKVPFHLDTIVRDACIYVDDELIFENGQLLGFPHALLCEEAV